ncbi:hypothetical protein P2W68_08390 [Chryseobacterium arthrosphaerae]|uniref:jacalin-like lectin n=1 Tax=Chryseobacterium arthrosphaerae TaxID=651561 RepID=UPI0023E0DC14|nr:hypothetical protein [Chryseobacterium arthrosphaerae]WES99630.1 hypothetical protein P2W68_08390 [Chryseobacterium arthrosphaerae]
MNHYIIKSIGGGGGSLFDMSIVQSIGIHAGKYVDQIIINGVTHGGGGGDNDGTLILEDDEFVQRIDYSAGKYIDYIKFTTNKKPQYCRRRQRRQ